MTSIKKPRPPQGAAVSLLQKWMMSQMFTQHYSGANLKVANALLNFRNSTSGQCNPSHKTIAETVGIHERTSKRAVKRLIRDGWLTKHGRIDSYGDQTSNQYVFNFARLAALNAAKGTNVVPLLRGHDASVTTVVTPVSPGSDNVVTGVVTPVSPESRNRSQEGEDQESESFIAPAQKKKSVIDFEVPPSQSGDPFNADDTTAKLALSGKVFNVTDAELADLQAAYKFVDVSAEVRRADRYYQTHIHQTEQRPGLLDSWLARADREAEKDIKRQRSADDKEKREQLNLARYGNRHVGN